MTKYIVNVREVHIQMVSIDATSPQEAIVKVEQGDGEYIDNGLEYSHTISSDKWTVDEVVPMEEP